MSMITESEKKRLQSLKEKKQAFKTKGRIIQRALSNLDNITKNNKIIFDDDFGKQQDLKTIGKKKRDLFDNDNDDSENDKESLWNENEFSIKKTEHKKITLGNDARFTLDDRFAEDDQTKNAEIIGNTDECDLQKEKEKQLDILESVLGAPLTMKRHETKSAKKELMIRYDPTENGHCEYEIKLEQPEIKEKSIKMKKCEKPVLESEEHASIEVSKDVYYTVSNTLTESLKQKEGFSLLKSFGREKDDTNVENCNLSIAENIKDQKFRFSFNANDAFKYDLSDKEDAVEALDADKGMINEITDNNHTNSLFGYKDTLFFDSNDVRFNEAVRFFDTETVPIDEFKKLRRELKIIVRTKIRKNERRYQPWGKKKKIKRS